jgi:hypothetical protein
LIEDAKKETGAAIFRKDFKKAREIINDLGRQIVGAEAGEKAVDEVLDLLNLVNVMEKEQLVEVGNSDVAATTTPDAASVPSLKGGIDFNEQYLKMNIKQDGNGVPLPIDQQDLNSIRIDGLVPNILSITPVTSLPILAG